MKTADDWYQDGLAALDRSRGADHHSEYVGDLEEAVAAFDRTLALDPDHASAAGDRGLLLAQLGRHAAAVDALAAALLRNPGDVDRRLVLAQSLGHLGRQAEALCEYDAVLRARPGDPEAMFGRAASLESLGRHAAALDAWDAVLGLADNRTLNLSGRTVHVTTSDFRRSGARLSRACALARLGRSEDAVAAFLGVFATAGRDLHGPLQPEQMPAALRELEAARVAYRRHLAERADDPLAWRLAGQTWLRAGLSDEALAAYDTMIALTPDDADAWWGRAEALAQAGRREEALPAFHKALGLNPVARLGIAARLAVVEADLAAERAARAAGCFRVMGRDTFAREDYVVGEFTTEEEAKACIRRKEASTAASQDEDLRDSFWIVRSR